MDHDVSGIRSPSSSVRSPTMASSTAMLTPPRRTPPPSAERLRQEGEQESSPSIPSTSPAPLLIDQSLSPPPSLKRHNGIVGRSATGVLQRLHRNQNHNNPNNSNSSGQLRRRIPGKSRSAASPTRGERCLNENNCNAEWHDSPSSGAAQAQASPQQQQFRQRSSKLLNMLGTPARRAKKRISRSFSPVRRQNSDQSCSSGNNKGRLVRRLSSGLKSMLSITSSSGSLSAMAQNCSSLMVDEDLMTEEELEAIRNPQLQQLLDGQPHVQADRDSIQDLKIMKIISDDPRCAAVKYRFSSGKTRTTTRGTMTTLRYPFYRAVALGASIETIRLLYKAHPPAIQHGGRMRKLPLHVACTYPESASVEVLMFLIEEYPDALQARTKHGYLPLHNACEYGLPLEVVQLLVQHCPNAKYERNKLRDRPFDCAKRQGACKEILELVRVEENLETGNGGGDVLPSSSDALEERAQRTQSSPPLVVSVR